MRTSIRIIFRWLPSTWSHSWLRKDRHAYAVPKVIPVTLGSCSTYTEYLLWNYYLMQMKSRFCLLMNRFDTLLHFLCISKVEHFNHQVIEWRTEWYWSNRKQLKSDASPSFHPPAQVTSTHVLVHWFGIASNPNLPDIWSAAVICSRFHFFCSSLTK